MGALAFPPMGLTAAVLTWRLGSDESLKRRARVAWRTGALAMFFYTGGDLLWAYYELVLGIEPFPSLAGVGNLLFYPTLMPGLMTVPFAPRSKASHTSCWPAAGTGLLQG